MGNENTMAGSKWVKSEGISMWYWLIPTLLLVAVMVCGIVKGAKEALYEAHLESKSI